MNEFKCKCDERAVIAIFHQAVSLTTMSLSQSVVLLRGKAVGERQCSYYIPWLYTVWFPVLVASIHADITPVYDWQLTIKYLYSIHAAMNLQCIIPRLLLLLMKYIVSINIMNITCSVSMNIYLSLLSIYNYFVFSLYDCISHLCIYKCYVWIYIYNFIYISVLVHMLSFSLSTFLWRLRCYYLHTKDPVLRS